MPTTLSRRPTPAQLAVRVLGASSALAMLCAFGMHQVQADTLECGGDYVCIEKQAVEQRCLGMPVDVTAATDDERRVVCSAAAVAVRLLGRCGIALRRPLNVQIMSEVRHPFGSGRVMFGLLDTKQERVLVTQEANAASLVKDTPYARLPLRDFYRSLIVHEVVHGVMHQNLKRPVTNHAVYEYPAYALQIESLAPELRDSFLQAFDQKAIRPDSAPFNDVILSLDPYFFAARAYQHFKASLDGCVHLTALLEGEVAFIAPPQM